MNNTKFAMPPRLKVKKQQDLTKHELLSATILQRFIADGSPNSRATAEEAVKAANFLAKALIG